jgi:hypothetical protein
MYECLGVEATDDIDGAVDATRDAGFIDGCKYSGNGRGLSIGTKRRPRLKDDIGDATETTVLVRVEPACASFP